MVEIQDYSYTYGASKHTGEHPNIWEYQNIQGMHQNIWGSPNIQGAPKHTGGHPNIWGHSNMGGIQTYRECIQTYEGIQMYRVIWTPLTLTKHAFFVLCLYRGHPTIIQTYRGASKHMGVSKNTGGYPNIQGASKKLYL